MIGFFRQFLRRIALNPVGEIGVVLIIGFLVVLAVATFEVTQGNFDWANRTGGLAAYLLFVGVILQFASQAMHEWC